MAKHWWVLAGGQTGTEDAGVLCPYLVLHHSRNSAFEKILHFHVPVCKFAKKLEVNAHFGWTKEYSRASIGACNGGAGSCICMGPQVCGSWGPFPMGTWQSYTSACCGCVPAPPVAPVAAAAPVAAPVAAAPVAAPVAAPAAAAATTDSQCAVHKGCADLKLAGTCCPAADGTYLGCCDVSALEENVTLAQLTVKTNNIPAWCSSLPETERSKADARPQTSYSARPSFINLQHVQSLESC